MLTCKQTIGLLLGLLGALVLSVPNAQAGPNLPVFTSPVDVTGWTLDLQVWAPQRDTGQPLQVTQLLPPTMIPSNFAVLNGSVLSTKFDQFWNGPDPKTGKTVRTEACDGINGIKQQV
jgi:hypothetical protein